MSFLKDMDGLCKRLTAAGVRTTIDPPAIRPPGGWLALDRVREISINGDRKYTYRLYLIAPAVDIPRALKILEKLLDKAVSEIGGIITEYDLSAQLSLPDGSACPAFALTLEPH